MGINIYGEDSWCIPRRSPLFSQTRKPVAILVSLNHIQDLFILPADNINLEGYDLDLGRPAPDLPDMYLYPQGFLKRHGHVQVNGIPLPLKDIVTQINNMVVKTQMRAASLVGSDAGSEDFPDLVPLGSYLMAITGDSMLIYNTVMHRLRPRANKHDTQLGQITNAFTGTYTTRASQKRIGDQKVQACHRKLPHEHFRQRVDHTDMLTALHLEYVSTIHMDSVVPQHRNSQSVHCLTLTASSTLLTPTLTSSIYSKVITQCAWAC
jgi:hypothetical protein